MAQWKRAGLIIPRSLDRNELLLLFLSFSHFSFLSRFFHSFSTTPAPPTSTMTVLIDILDLSQRSLLISLLIITFNPLAWNVVARNGPDHCCCRSYTTL